MDERDKPRYIKGSAYTFGAGESARAFDVGLTFRLRPLCIRGRGSVIYRRVIYDKQPARGGGGPLPPAPPHFFLSPLPPH
ncbi:hypothetical protein EVAR_44626_1 [Eumeta japonica]|uniref:Uncharacterized protein n=1 Tax=Eumeta variegata TaxID=151549 RepID=A0A4C1YZM5_EUMVA|nr:hypothetical protein EVAR_44626_1 [Eumeta japonica]